MILKSPLVIAIFPSSANNKSNWVNARDDGGKSVKIKSLMYCYHNLFMFSELIELIKLNKTKTKKNLQERIKKLNNFKKL